MNQHTMHLADVGLVTPPPGFAFRGFRGEGDYPLMADIINRANVADGDEAVESVEGIAANYAHLTNCDLATDYLMAEDEAGRAVAYTRVWWDQDDQGSRRYFHLNRILPEARRRGLGRAMLRWAESRLRAIAAQHADDSPKHFFVWAYNLASIPGKVRLLEAEGYTPVRYGFMMTRSLLEPIDVPPLPGGLEVRPARPEHFRQVHAALDEAFRDHWGHRPSTEQDFQSWVKWPLLNPALWQVAWAEDDVAGLVLNFISADDNAAFNLKRGWADPIAVRRPWRRRGLARALIMRSLQLLKEQGMTEAALGVDTQNPNGALQLYESCGFKAVKRSAAYWKELAAK